jgi:hypothetical protein
MMRSNADVLSEVIEKHLKSTRHIISNQAFPYLEDLNYKLVLPPENHKIKAWDKLKEFERRLS